MSKDAQKITRFIDKYRASISTDIMQSGEYSFKAFLIQVANHKSVDALPVQFFPYDKLTDDEKKKVERIAGLIKEKHIPVVNKGTFSLDHAIAKGVSKYHLLPSLSPLS